MRPYKKKGRVQTVDCRMLKKKTARAGVEEKCPMVYLKHKKEQGFLICMNMAIYGTRTIQKNEKFLKWQSFEKKSSNFVQKSQRII